MIALFKVLRCTPRKRHGGVHVHGTTTYNADGTRSRTFARTFSCACGDDGDPLHPTIDVHVNCAELVA